MSETARQSHQLLEIIRWEPLRADWGAQIGVAELRLLHAPTGMCIRLPVFRGRAGEIFCGMPVVPGVAPGARYSGIYFDADIARSRFLEAVVAALETIAPELFEREGRP